MAAASTVRMTGTSRCSHLGRGRRGRAWRFSPPRGEGGLAAPGNTRRRPGKLVSSRHRVLQQAAPSLLQKALSSWAHCLARSRVDPDSLGISGRRPDGEPAAEMACLCLTSTRPEAPGMGAQRRVGRDDVTLSRLHRGHRRGRPALSTGRTIMLSAVSPLLVGRERELRLLRGHLAASVAGRGRLVLVGGTAGIGKTTLVAAVAREAESNGVLVLDGACYDLTATPPYGPWRDLAAGYRPAAGLPAAPRRPHRRRTDGDRAVRVRSSPRCGNSWPPWPPSAPCSWCWRTCTGRIPPASTFSDSSLASSPRPAPGRRHLPRRRDDP